jgi:UDP-2,3-diacylglucosamine hydrolase
LSFRAYFVSDLHLKSKDERSAQIFVRFLRRLQEDDQLTHLFLLGDIFDFWISDHGYFIEKFHLIVEEIDRLSRSGIEVHYFEGNHDLHLERYWHRKLGVKVHNQAQYFMLGNKTLRLEHGDLINPDDRGYLFLKSMLNTSAVKVFADHMHESFVAKLGEYSSQMSRHYTSYNKFISEEKQKELHRAHARRAYSEKPFDLIISGHIHVRDDESFLVDDKSVRAVNLGTWLKQPCAFILTDTSSEFQTLV